MSFVPRENEGVSYFVSTLLPCPHAFSTRLGGVSTKPHLASMNIGENRGDEPGNPEKNLRLLTRAAGLSDAVITARQVHSAKLLYVPGADGVPEEKPELDGFYTDRAGVALCVKIADCLPILICDGGTGNIAALHAGWRGSASGIARAGVEALVSLGGKPEDLFCAIGPGIGECCFEVKDDFVSEFSVMVSPQRAQRFLHRRDGRIYADLKGFNREELLRAGVREDRIDVCPLCTCCRPDLFFSHRYSHGLRGTMGALIEKKQR